MPDTGAPWNIPYVDPTDLVRDYPQASEDLADAIADGLDAAGSPGIGSNVVQVEKDDPFTSTSTTPVVVTGLSLNFTPTTNTSKVLIIASITFASQTANVPRERWSVYRDGTNLVVPASPGSRPAAVHSQSWDGLNQSRQLWVTTWMYLDSPATASQVTYDVRANTSAAGGTVFVNRDFTDTDSVESNRAVSQLIAIEVAP
jgi:hypothetical protein